MHIPEIFAEYDSTEIVRLISAHPLASIIYSEASGLDAEHVPLIFDGVDRLIGHFAANNAIIKTLKNGDAVLAIFSGEDSYISPNWYPTKTQHHQHLPTWNFQKVHVYGKLNFLSGEKSARAVVGKLTKSFEILTNGKSAWKMSDAPAEYIDEMLSKITPFEIEIDRVTAKSKVSQNRGVEDFQSVISAMESTGRLELSDRMKRFIDTTSGTK